MNDADALAAVDRWWPYSGSESMLKAGGIDPSHPFAAHAHEVLGKRVLGDGGGTITRLTASEAA